jgi:hypothetical protein
MYILFLQNYSLNSNENYIAHKAAKLVYLSPPSKILAFFCQKCENSYKMIQKNQKKYHEIKEM